PIITWDYEAQEEIMIVTSVLHLPADNPMQLYLCSHIGLSGNHFCEECNIGGTQEHKQTDEGYHKLFEGLLVEDRQCQTGVKDSLTEPIHAELIKQCKELVKKHISLGNDPYAPLSSLEIKKELREWLDRQKNHESSSLCLDPSQDTLMEPLHTVLLGVIKNIWSITCLKIAETKELPTLQA
ncbi:hypothetical protein M422DRAFT_169944, partial [Sphaerobolus stellatus SS14]